MSGFVDLPNTIPVAIRLSSQQITPANMRTIAGYIRGHRVETIDLGSTHLNDESTVILTQAVKASGTVRFVYLANNNVGNVGAKAIAECIATGRNVTWHVTRNKIGAEGGEALAKAWALNRNNYSISLGHNELGDDGAKRVAVALRQNKGNITNLHLTHNGIGPNGDKALAENVPLTIDVTYQTEEVTASEYFNRHRCLYVFMCIIFFPIALLTPFLPNFEDDKPGLLNGRTGPRA